MENWKTYKLEEAIEKLIDYRGKTPKKTTHGVPLVTAKVIKGGRILEPKEFISREDYEPWMRRGIPEVGDVVLTTEAPLGEVAQIKSADIALAQRVITLRGKVGVLDSGYLKYFLQSSIGQSRLEARQSGTTVFGIKQTELRKVEVDCPSYSEQRAIASILSALDDKIENNLAMNKTLEDMAMALYKHWFVDFGPFQEGNFIDSELGPIPEGWEVIKLEELVEIKYGKDHKKLDSGNIPVYGSGGIMRYVDSFLYDKESVLVPRKGTLSNIFLVNVPFWSVDTMFYTKMKKDNILKYTFHLLKTLKLADMDVGSAVPSLTTKLLNFLDVILPDQDVLKNFEEQVTELYEQIWANTNENQTLTQLRDTLLPKLISGEVRLAAFDEEITAALCP